MIQIITTDESKGNMVKEFKNEKIKVSTFERPRSLDEFDINIIDLSCEVLWNNVGANKNSIDDISNIEQVSTMIVHASKTKILVVMPTSISYKYDSLTEIIGDRVTYNMDYQYEAPLKNILYLVEDVFTKLTGYSVELYYEPTTTIFEDVEGSADFCFVNSYKGLTYSEKSKKMTTTEIDERLVITTINLFHDLETTLFSHSPVVTALLRHIGWIKNAESEPKWMSDIEMFDDKRQKLKIVQEEAVIEKSKGEIEGCREVLYRNSRWKSILYQTGDELVKVITEILEDTFDVNLSDFIDEKREDFCFFVNEAIFIGEIKGVSKNLKADYISQLDRHYQNYVEGMNDNEQSKVKALLIINYQRTKRPEERIKIDQQQERLAKRNESLIIETSTLLRLYEKYKRNEVSSKAIFEMFYNTTGVLNIN